MLKDLDQRQEKLVSEQSSASQPLVRGPSPQKMVLIALIIIVLLNVIGLFFWQLYSENQSLKALHNKPSSQVNIPEQHVSTAPIKDPNKAETNILTRDIVKTDLSTIKSNEDKTANQRKLKTSVTNSVNDLKSDGANGSRRNNSALIKTGILNEKNLIEQDSVEKGLNKKTQTKEARPAVVQTEVLPEIPASLSISRRQMSPQDLAQQKYSRAEQAILDEKIIQAEQLFEEILLLQPNHKAARKQLAALWFGRQSYQPALNLLSQGIALTPQDSEYRLMKARIYLNQGQTERALQTLLVLADYPNIEYQALLANTAQQQGQFVSAITAYQQLVNLQGNKGRWWLGLAIAFDSNSQFLKAAQAYQIAISQQNLSPSSAEFAQKRLIELGE